MKQKCLLAMAAAAGLVVMSHGAVAKGFNYSYGEFGYENTNSDLYDGDGFQAAFSYGATDYIHVVGSFSRLWVDKRQDATKVDLDLDEFRIGMGGHYPILKKVDIGATVVYIDDQITGKELPDGAPSKVNVNESEDGYEVLMFGRIQATKKLEISPHVSFLDIGSFSGTGFGAGFIYNFYKDFSAQLESTYFSNDSTTDLFAGIRLDF
jgi:hypothetical protein